MKFDFGYIFISPFEAFPSFNQTHLFMFWSWPSAIWWAFIEVISHFQKKIWIVVNTSPYETYVSTYIVTLGILFPNILISSQ